MLRIFNDELADSDNFIITLELVPGRESMGRNTDTLKGIARDAFSDGRVSAVSITDNPGGNPSLSPDLLGYEIFKYGLDVIVHFTCRDMNRMGMESRALQLARLGMKNILALTGDYAGKAFGGIGKPVFDLDSVILTSMLQQLSDKLLKFGDPDGFFTGCAVSPFKYTRAESSSQYAKLNKKIAAGASFVITQLGYDVEKFKELITHMKQKGDNTPLMGSVYLLSPRSARAMNRGRVPGAYIRDDLFADVTDQWKDKRSGLKASIDRAARLGVILKDLGYRGIHIGGIHRNFKTVGAILDRMDEIESSGEIILDDFKTPPDGRFYLFTQPRKEKKPPINVRLKDNLTDHYPYELLKRAHGIFFNKDSKFAPFYKKTSEILKKSHKEWLLKLFFEDPIKKIVLSCQGCGDCAIQHTAFLCPESGCPKFTRNGACGGSLDGWCEVNSHKRCIWVRAFKRLEYCGKDHTLMDSFVPPRMWELNKTSSWINFHLNLDHQKNKFFNIDIK